MKILVAVKHVPHTETKVKVGADGGSLDESGVKWVISPYDEFAIELGLQLRDAEGGEVVAVCCGPATAQATLRQALAMGADRAVLLQDDRYAKADGVARARALAAVARAEDAELVLAGKYGVGTDENQTGPMVAELLDWPHASAIGSFEKTDGGFTVKRQVEGATEIQQGSLPAVLTCDKGLNEPRYASLKGIMQAKKKPLETKTPADFGLDEGELDAPRLVWEALELPPPRGEGKIIDGDAATAARELARVLRDEAKVI